MQTLSRLLSLFYFDVLIGGLTKTQCWRYSAFARNAALCARSYQAGEERRIIRLFLIVFRKHKSLSRWRWEFLENPYAKTNIAVLESNKVGIVGHYGGILVRFNYHGNVIPVSQAVDVMIHPAFRGRAVLENLFRAYIQVSRGNGIKLVYGFTERAFARSNRRFFGFEFASVSEWVREIPHSPASHEPAHYPAAAQFDVHADALWERIKRSYPCATVRDSQYLNWRYSPRSDRKYALWQMADPTSGRIAAMVVLGESKSDGLILELLAEADDAKSIVALLRASIGQFSRAGKSRVRVWLSAHGKLRQCAQAEGFRPVDSGLYLNLLSFDTSLDAATIKESFYYSLGDYDVY
jgi:hypothetical protein